MVEISDESTQESWWDETDEIIPYQYTITSYGADYPVDGLVKRMANQEIFIPPFQRGYVWSLKEASRFIETLLLGLPVPGIFLSKEQDTQKLLVIDGQQRLKTLQFFYDGIFVPNKAEFALRYVQSVFNGVTFKTLKPEDRRLLDDSILHATIVKQDQPSDDLSSIYHIFERLNTSGRPLSPQEIRACIYHGELIEFLKDINNDAMWRSIYGKVNTDMRDQELILRFFALYFYVNKYEKPMKGFINKYAGLNRHLTVQNEKQMRSIFQATVKLIFDTLGSKAFRPKGVMNAAVFDSVMVGLARRIERGEIKEIGDLESKYDSLLEDQAFVSSSTTATTDNENVQKRITIATAVFSTLK